MKQEVFNQYVDKVAEQVRITKEELFSKSKRRELSDARHLLYYLCSVRHMQITYIQKYMRENGYEIQHSSIIHGINSVEKKVEKDVDYRNIVKEISKSVSI